MNLKLLKKEFTLFKNALLVTSVLFLTATSGFSQCAYPTGASQVGSDYTFCIDSQDAFTTAKVNAGQYVVVNVVKGFKYTFSVTDVFAADNENLSIFNVTGNAPVTTGFATGASGTSISNWQAPFSGKIKILLSKGSCVNDNSTGGKLTLTLNSVGNTQDDQTAYGTDKWVGHVYNWTGTAPPGGATSPATPSASNPFTAANYVGYYNVGTETINEDFGGSIACFQVLTDGVNRTNIYTDKFAVRYRMKSNKTGYYFLNVTGDDGIRVYVDNVLVFNEWKEQSSTNYCNNLIYLKGDSDIVLDYYENGGENKLAFELVASQPTANAIAGAAVRNVCGSTQLLLDGNALSACTGSANSGVIFQWQSSVNNSTFTNITGATAEDYTPANSPNSVVYYRRLMKSKGLNSTVGGIPSNVIRVNTSSSSVGAIGTISGTTPQCPSVTGQMYSVIAVPNALNYDWTVPTGWSITAGQGTNSITVTTGITGQNGTISVTASNGCAAVATTTLAVTVSIPTPLGNNNISYTNGTSGQVNGDVAENASLTLTAPAGTYFSQVNFASYGTPSGTSPNFVINSSCHSSTSQSVTEGYLLGNTGSITIPATNAAFGDPCSGTLKKLIVLTSYAQAICSGTSLVITGTTPTGGTGTFTYLWESSTTSATTGFTAAAGTNNGINYTSAALTQTTWFRRVVTSCSNSSTSTVVLVKVNPKTIPTFTQVANICNGETLAALPTTSINGITGTWSPALNNTATTVYTFTPTTGQCAATATMTINVGGITTWNGASWDNGAPTAGIKAIIAENYSANEDITACSLIVNSGKILKIKPTKTLTVGLNLTNNGSIVFESDATGTGRFAEYNGAAITGSGTVTVQRYITGRRAYRFLTPSVTTTSSIRANWQNGGASTASIGTHITGLGGATNGFDPTGTNNPSLHTYNAQALGTTTGFTAVTSTTATTLKAGVGYRVLVRGDRNVILTNPSADNMNVPTTLSATGTLTTGTVTFDSSASSPAPVNNNATNTQTNGYTLIGNPYVSPVDWNAVTKTGVKNNAYYTWDPTLGTMAQRGRYVVYSPTLGTNMYSDGTLNSTNRRYLQTGQAVFIKNTDLAVPATVTFKETNKATTNSYVFRSNEQAMNTTGNAALFLTLYDPNELAIGAAPIDGALALFGADYATALDANDVDKLGASGENVAFVRENKNLAIETVAPVAANDELFVKTIQFQANKNYTFKVNTINFDTTVNAKMVDLYLNTETPIDLTQPSFVTFATTTDANSYGSDRFKIVFSNVALTNESFNQNSVTIYPNPIVNNQFTISLPSQLAGDVTVTMSNVLGQEIYKSTTEAAALINVQPKQTLDEGVYIVSISNNGQVIQSKVIVRN